MAPEILVDIEKGFEAGLSVHVNFKLPIDSSWTILFGPSGAGKTTVLRCIAGLDIPQRGLIKFNHTLWLDTENRYFHPPQKRNIGYLFQEYALFPHLNVMQNITYNLTGISKEERNDRLERMLNLFQINGIKDRRPSKISGGEKQRVALARTLIRKPQLLLLDEPFSALDIPTRERLRREIRSMLKEFGIPIILVTHDRIEAITLGDRIAVMNNGTVQQIGSVQEVFSRPANSDVARVVGMENVMPGRVVGRRDGLLIVRVQGRELTAVDPGGLKEEVMICIRAEEIILELAPAGFKQGEGSPLQSSARNRLPARVTGISDEGVMVRVYLDCGFPLIALITRLSCNELSLSEGVEVLVSLKAPSIHIMG
ncbi:MAG: ABC transporter ATP-binding protein [Nitrospinae bacterium]|nr:ABC transporter ATP-binding protein [Nitrospinota bacterium]